MSNGIDIKKTARVMQFCNEMYERGKHGLNYPSSWMVKTREALEGAGVVAEVSGGQLPHGKQYYFTTSGLAWFLANNGEDAGVSYK